jgi:hypothetical protein
VAPAAYIVLPFAAVVVLTLLFALPELLLGCVGCEVGAGASALDAPASRSLDAALFTFVSGALPSLAETRPSGKIRCGGVRSGRNANLGIRIG